MELLESATIDRLRNNKTSSKWPEYIRDHTRWLDCSNRACDRCDCSIRNKHALSTSEQRIA